MGDVMSSIIRCHCYQLVEVMGNGVTSPSPVAIEGDNSDRLFGDVTEESLYQRL
jgi:hypothetical protein